jgi:coproporphyrinogen III oxidase
MFGVGGSRFLCMWTWFGFASKNPMVPTVHASWRYFEMYDTSTELSSGPRKVIQQWFGGGQDLTPYYLFEEDAIHFPQTCKTTTTNLDFIKI